MSVLAWLVFLGAASWKPAAAPPTPTIPLIVTGWDSPNTQEFREDIAAFERWGVFDGTTLTAYRVLKGGEKKAAIFAFKDEKWDWSEFASSVDDLRHTKPKTCLQNYVLLYANPGNVDWFDDAGWKNVVEHWRLLARLAKQGGLRGILFDPEPYTKPFSQFLFAAQPKRDAHSFAEYRAQARKRGREVIQAVRSEFPDAVIFAYRLFSDMLDLPSGEGQTAALEPHVYGLLPAFVDGWLDAMPAGMRVIDGTEAIGYHANSRGEYESAYARLRLRMPGFLAPEHAAAVRRQLLVGHSLYLDAYLSAPGSPWHIDSTGSSPSTRLSANLRSAMDSSESVVWLYGEKGLWWNAGSPSYSVWPKAFPGVLGAIRRAKDPTGFAREFWGRSPKPANLLPNARLSGEGESPTGWFFWQDGNSHGSSRAANGEIQMSGVLNGVNGVGFDVVPGRSYAVRVKVRTEGRGVGLLNVGWKTKDEKWTAVWHEAKWMPTGEPDSNGRREIVGWVEVPAEAARMVFMVAAAGQASEADRVWFSDPAVAEIADSE